MTDLNQFVRMLNECESIPGNAFTDWESKFVADMREKWDAREDQSDMGMTPWLPTRNQYNTLHGIWSTL